MVYIHIPTSLGVPSLASFMPVVFSWKVIASGEVCEGGTKIFPPDSDSVSYVFIIIFTQFNYQGCLTNLTQ